MLKNKKIKTIDLNFKEWFDRINGNSYHAGTVTINYGMKTEKVFNCPFEYGYEDAYKQTASKKLIQEKIIHTNENHFVLWRYCQENKIILRTNIQRNCSKRELKQFED